MKLLGRLHRGHKKEKAAAPSPATDWQARQRYNNDVPPINLAVQQNQPSHYRPDSNGSNSFASFKFDDETTMDGNNTLYDWSICDNAPSVGSAGELFADGGNKYSMKHHTQWFRPGYSSSSDDDDDSSNNEVDDTVMTVKYSKLSDSPPPKSASSMRTMLENDTPLRKGGKKEELNTPSRKGQRLVSRFEKGRIASNDIDLADENDSSQRKPPHIPLQALNRRGLNNSATTKSQPVDVDSFIGASPTKSLNGATGGRYTISGKENVVPMRRRQTSSSQHEKVEVSLKCGKPNIVADDETNSLPPCVKGKIHALSFNDDEDDPFNSSMESSESSCADIDNASMRNLVDKNSPFTKGNVKNKNKSTRDDAMIKKNLEMNSNASGPTSTDTRCSGDCLLHDGDAETNSSTSKNEETYDFREATGRNKVKKTSIKNQMKNKFQSLVGSKNKDNSEGRKVANNKLIKPKLRKQLSEFSMEPLTGIENGFVQTNAKARKELYLEIQRRKVVERQVVERKEMVRRQRIQVEGLEKERRRVSASKRAEIEKRKYDMKLKLKGNKNSESDTLEIERRQNREKLQNWVVGLSPLRFDDDTRKSDELIFGSTNPRLRMSHDASTACIDNTSKRQDELIFGSTNPRLRMSHDASTACIDNTSKRQDELIFGSTNPRLRMSHDASTACIDNTSKRQAPIKGKGSITFEATCSTIDIDNTSKRQAPLEGKGSFGFETNPPDEDSSAQSPFPIAPPPQQNLSCVICKKEERTHLAVPCMHFSFCGKCVDERKESAEMKCTVCNRSVTSFSKVFY